ncbi:MAG: hypothetical protein AB1730_25630, partial [Myxococcota bacterium]
MRFPYTVSDVLALFTAVDTFLARTDVVTRLLAHHGGMKQGSAAVAMLGHAAAAVPMCRSPIAVV